MTTAWGSVGEKAGTHPLPLVLAGAVLFLGMGGALVSIMTTHPLPGVIGLAMLALGVGVPVTLVLERRWNRTRPGPQLSTDPETGAPSTLVACAPWTGAQRWIGALVLLVPLGAAAVAALASGRAATAVVVGALAVFVAHLLAPWVAAEGVHLSASGITVRHYGRPRHVAWDDVRDVDMTMWFEIERVRGRRVRFTPRQLAVRWVHLWVHIRLCLVEPDRRLLLGTSASLDPGLWGARS
ncbi:hypothetical protein GCM10009756_03670 [Pseudokineococcus marinus]